MKVAAVQINAGENKLSNISNVLSFIDKAANKGAELIALPEYVDYLDEDARRLDISETLPGMTSELFSKKATEHGIYIHCGSIMEKGENSKIYNTSILFNKQGEIIKKYRKIHLFDAQLGGRIIEKESSFLEPGNEIVTAETEYGAVGFSICHDLRFPEVFRSLALKGAKVIFVPASFAFYTGASHWEVLLRARAIENQCYIVAANQFGRAEPNRSLYGNSMIINPWGTVIARAGEQEDIIMADIDFNYIEKTRTNLPSLLNRRPDVYDTLSLNGHKTSND